jgi:hypothetical protein
MFLPNGIHKMLRLAVLVLLAVAFIGPWTYSMDGVPPPEWCAEPNFLLTPERCARLLPGTEILSLLGSFLIALPVNLFSSEFPLADRGRELLFVLLLTLLFLPFISTLILSLARNTRRWLVLDLAAWGLAAVPVVIFFLSLPLQRGLRFWGFWLYIGLAAAMLLLGLWGLIKNGRAGSSLSTPV